MKTRSNPGGEEHLANFSGHTFCLVDRNCSYMSIMFSLRQTTRSYSTGQIAMLDYLFALNLQLRFHRIQIQQLLLNINMQLPWCYRSKIGLGY